jgi:uncharacterized protein (TIGR02099 family)
VTAPPTARRIRLLRPLVWFTHTGIKLFVAAYFLLALTVVGVRYLVLPKVSEYREEVAAAVSRAIGARVTIDDLEASWSGLHPMLAVNQLRIHDAEGRVALALPTVRAQVSWRSVALWDLRFHSLVFEGPSLAIRRTADGRLRVAGIELGEQGGGDQSLGDWVLRQGEIVIERGQIQWIDEKRGAPPLALSDVGFRLVNRFGSVHRVALRAVPPAALASPFEVRADLRGSSLETLERWDGRAWANLEYVDLAAWRQWIDYPVEIAGGRGALRLWLDFEDLKVIDATADLALSDVVARIDPRAPPLALRELAGRAGIREVREGSGIFGWREKRSAGFIAFARGIEVATARDPRMAPFDLAVRWDVPAGGGTPRGEVKASRLDLQPVVRIAESLPMPRAVRDALRGADPRGVVTGLDASWSGELDAPATYAARGAFERLVLKPTGGAPGFDTLGGSFELTHQGGTISAAGDAVKLVFPNVFRAEPVLGFDKVDLRAEWARVERDGATALEVRVPRLGFANRDLQVDGEARWRATEEGPGVLDVDLNVARLAVPTLWRYLPRLNDRAAVWMRRAILAGTASGTVKLKGDLRKFPFASADEGVFEVRGRAQDGVLEFADDWPRIDGIAGEVRIDNREVLATVPRATTSNAQLSNTRVRVADWDGADPVLEVDGTADATGADYLAYVQATPLRDGIGRVLGPMTVDGRARLGLAIGVPLRHSRDTRVTGNVQFAGNRIVFDPDQPPVTQVTGRLDFTDKAFTARNVAAQFLGGPTTVTIATREDRGVVVAAQGSAAVREVAATWSFPFASRTSGIAPYRANVTIGAQGNEIQVDSTLQGVAIDLPAPLGKTAAETVPFRFERVVDADRNAGRNQLGFGIGQRVQGTVRFRSEAGGAVPDRVGIGVGEATPTLPDRTGIDVAVDLPSIDADALLAAVDAEWKGKGEGGAAGRLPLLGVTVKTPYLIGLGRRFNQVTLRATPLPRDGWRLAVATRETSGDVEWQPAGSGRVRARLKSLVIPEAASTSASERTGETRELPALDVVAESFVLGGKSLGRLELAATNEARRWRITNLALNTPEATLRATGAWEPGRASQHTDVDFTIETIDAGRYLERLGQPNTVAGGVARLGGRISWDGAPYAIDYRTMSGNLTFHADKGRFLKAQPGVTRLMGVLSLQNLPRRISFDFRDVFAEGFTFDQINATAVISKGTLATQDFRMTGPQAGVVLTGDVDLERETQDLRVRVVPIVGDSIAAVAGLALLNPMVGLGTLIAQRLLRDPLGQVLAHEYAVTGSWDDPKVDRLTNLDREPAAAPATETDR